MKAETAQAKEARATDAANANAAGVKTIIKDTASAAAADQHTAKTAETRRNGYNASEQEANHVQPVPTSQTAIWPLAIVRGPRRALFGGMCIADAAAYRPDNGGAPATP